ncbi:hypothetical protein GCM10027347_61220 [Larkinella harenae]
MQREQNYSGKGETTSPSHENGAKNGQTVNTPDQSNIPSCVIQANAQIEATIADFMAEHLEARFSISSNAALAARIKNIVSTTFLGAADISPDTTLPLFVQVPNFIAERLGDEDRFRQELAYAIEAMRDFAVSQPGETVDKPNYEGVYYSFMQIIESASMISKARELGFDLTPNTPSKGDKVYDPSIVSRVNAQVEAAITYLVTSYAGSDIPDEELYKMVDQIKRTILQNFGDQQDKTSDSHAPILVQVHELFDTAVRSADKLYELRGLLEKMERMLLNDPQLQPEEEPIEQVFSALHFMISAAEHTANARLLGSGQSIPFVARPAVVTAEVNPDEVEPGIYDTRIVLDLARTTYFDACDGGGKTVTIESNSQFFDMLSNPEDLGGLIRNISAWYVSWVEFNGVQVYGDVPEGHRCFANIMHFLGLMPLAVTDVEVDKARAPKKGGLAK